jgi:hypothetical protein
MPPLQPLPRASSQGLSGVVKRSFAPRGWTARLRRNQTLRRERKSAGLACYIAAKGIAKEETPMRRPDLLKFAAAPPMRGAANVAAAPMPAFTLVVAPTADLRGLRKATAVLSLAWKPA